jgi:hypothetical protein
MTQICKFNGICANLGCETFLSHQLTFGFGGVSVFLHLRGVIEVRVEAEMWNGKNVERPAKSAYMSETETFAPLQYEFCILSLGGFWAVSPQPVTADFFGSRNEDEMSFPTIPLESILGIAQLA